MNDHTPWPVLPTEPDLTRPNAARMYDYLLDGAASFAADRTLVEQVLRQFPAAKALARTNRAFLGRAVRYAMQQRGIEQFLDLGSGLPTVGSVHEIADRLAPRARVVYVDREPVVVEHCRLILRDLRSPHRHRVVQADFRDPGVVLARACERDGLDLQRPVALLVVALLHFIGPQDNPEVHLRHYLEALPAGSLLVMSHMTDDAVDAEPVVAAVLAEQTGAAQRLYEATSTPLHLRNAEQFAALFAGTDLVEPGIVPAGRWHPEYDVDTPHDPAESMVLAGVGLAR
jgi:O-methyltransferase involved in polyketide biosynthesis